MINIQFNGKEMALSKALYLSDFLMEHHYQGNDFAVAVNQCFVPRHQYATCLLSEGDTIEILTAMQGG